MAYPPHLLISFGGSLGQEETWSCTLRMWDPAFNLVDSELLIQAGHDHVEEIDAKVRAFWVAYGPFKNLHAKYGFTKFNAIGPNGRYLGQQTAEILHSPHIAHNAGAPVPFQIATVISLRTYADRGIASRGRFFLPAGAYDVDVLGQMNSDANQAISNAATNFINDLNNWDGLDMPWSANVCVVSQGRLTKRASPGVPAEYGPGMALPVRSVMVGRVQDTQRRRRASLADYGGSGIVAV